MQVKGSPTHGSHSRGTPSFPAQLNLSPFSPPDLDLRGDSPTLSGKGSHLPVAPQEEAGLALKLERKPRGSCHIPKDTPWISPSIQGNSRWLDTSANVTPRMKSHPVHPDLDHIPSWTGWWLKTLMSQIMGCFRLLPCPINPRG